MRILVVLFVVGNVLGQNEYANQNNIHTEQIVSEKSDVEAITVSYNPTSHSTRSVLNVQISGAGDSTKNNVYNRDNRGRIRKIFRIKNPFQQTEEEEEGKETNKQSLKLDPQDTETGASNQYAAMQYSLPPEEFLQNFRVANQYYQQQQQQQVSSSASTFGYTTTPQPQYYSTTSATNFNNYNQQKSSISPLESRNPQGLNPNYNNYQYNNGYAFGIEAIQSTPSSVTLYLSTKSPSDQYVGTPSNTYVSSSSPFYQSSPSNLQSYISSTLSNIHQTGSQNNNYYNGHSTAGQNSSFNYGGTGRGNDQNVYVNHYGNSESGVHHPFNMHQQHQNVFPSSTQIPITSSTISDMSRDSWQNSIHYNLRSVPNTREEFSQPSRTNIIVNNQQENAHNANIDNNNAGTHGTTSMQSANNLFLSFVRPEYQTFNRFRNDHDMESQQTTQTDVYSYGDYGWKLDGKKALVKYDVSSSPNYLKQESLNYPGVTNYLSSPSKYLDTEKIYDYNQKSKINSEKLDDQDFAKAAAKALQDMKKQQQVFLNSYSSQIRPSPDNSMDSNAVSYKNHNDNKESNFVTSNPNTYISTSQNDVITASPYYFTNIRENILGKNDLASVAPDNTQIKFNVGADLNIGYNSTNADVDEQNFKHGLKSYQIPSYNDKNIIFNFNTKTKPEEKPPAFSSYHIVQRFDNQKQYESPRTTNNLDSNSQSNLVVPPYFGPSTMRNLQQPNNIQQQIDTRPQIQENNDSMNNLKINDIPHWLIRGLSSGNLRINNNDNGLISTIAPLILNQNVEAHQLDVAASILNKLIRERQSETSKPEYNSQAGPLLPTINNLKIINPYNLDLRLVAEILKGRSSLNDVSSPFYNQVNQQLPFRWDTSHLQQLMLKNDNIGSIVGSQNGMGTVIPFMEINNNGGAPYHGVKYSRSQEEEESLVPITDASLIYPIGAVIEQDESLRENREENDSDMAGSNDEDFTPETDDEKPQLHSNHRLISRNRPPNSLIPESHYHHHRKIPKINVREPYPLLRPPPPHSSNARYRKNLEHVNRRQRHNKLKVSRIVKREPVFEDEDFTNDDQPPVPILLRPPPIAEDKADTIPSDEN